MNLKKRIICILIAVMMCFVSFEMKPIPVHAEENLNDVNKTATTEYEGVDYSKVYDFEYYINKYEDIKAAFGNDDKAVLRHFVVYGMREGRRANAEFDVYSYKNANQDLRLAFGNDLKKYYEHYIKWGYRENRITCDADEVSNPVTTLNGVDYSKVYDYKYYINKYEDIKTAFGNDDIAVLKHFVTYGMKEGRQAKAAFDVYSYKNANQDLRLAFGNDLKKYYEHYIKWGYKENRVSSVSDEVSKPITTLNGVDYSKVYDYNYYINKYPDLKNAFGNDSIAALNHFVKYGMREGRRASSVFDVYSYKNLNKDLRLVFGNNLEKYYEHYIKYGYKEDRVTSVPGEVRKPVTTFNGVDYSKVYDYHYYINKYADLKKAFGDDDVAALRHFVTYGMNEGRQASALFNLKTYKANYEDLREAYGSTENSNEKYYMHYIKYGYNEVRNPIIKDGALVVDDDSDFVFVGDSRFFGMYRACYGSGGSYLACSGKGLDWLQPRMSSLYNMKGKYIVINMGVNDLKNIRGYIKFYNSFPDSFFENNKVIFMTVNPVDEELEKKYGIYKKNKDINNFNEIMKKELRSEFRILDSNYYMNKKGFVTYDGLHYSDETIRDLYKWIINECRQNRFSER